MRKSTSQYVLYTFFSLTMLLALGTVAQAESRARAEREGSFAEGWAESTESVLDAATACLEAIQNVCDPKAGDPEQVDEFDFVCDKVDSKGFCIPDKETGTYGVLCTANCV